MESKKRSIVKSISWRITAVISTIIIIFIITGNLVLGLSIGIVEILFKSMIYYAHERTWNKIEWEKSDEKNKK